VCNFILQRFFFHACSHTQGGKGSGCNYFTSSTADLTCTSEVVSDEVCTTLLERGGNLTIESEMCIVVMMCVICYWCDDCWCYVVICLVAVGHVVIVGRIVYVGHVGFV
jgi:hypothetical protein